MTSHSSRDRRAIGILLIGLAIANVARSTIIPPSAGFITNILVAAAVVALGVTWCGLSQQEMGTEPSHVRSGIWYGLAAFGIVTFVTAFGAAIPGIRHSFDVDDVHVGFAALIRKVAILIPLGTVVTEELIFRGVLHGLFSRLWSPVQATLAGSVVFGLWHVFPAWRADGATMALGTFLATALAGAIFVWLRGRSQSVVAPMFAHLATNTVPLLFGWMMYHS